MPWLGLVAGRVPSTLGRVATALVRLPNASVVVTTTAEGLGAVEVGSTVATSLQPAGKLPTALPSKVSGRPTGPAAAGPARHATAKARIAKLRCAEALNSPLAMCPPSRIEVDRHPVQGPSLG